DRHGPRAGHRAPHHLGPQRPHPVRQPCPERGDLYDRTPRLIGTAMPNHILIVDDELGILDTLSGILQDESYEVSVAAGGQNAIKLIKSDSPPDLVLLDIWMPDLDGIETLQRAMEAHPRRHVIMKLGHGSIQWAVKANKLSAYDAIETTIA